VLSEDGRLDAAEEAATRAITLVSRKGQESLLCELHQVLGLTHKSKGEKEKAIHHLETALEIASLFGWDFQLIWIHFSLARLFRDKHEFEDANTHIERAKSYAADYPYDLGRAMQLQAGIWYQQQRLEDAKSEALRALEIYEKCGAVYEIDAKVCGRLLEKVERAMKTRSNGFKVSLCKHYYTLRLLNYTP
jgi:tetratricopeptide (TPR) repeat protein